MHCVLGCNNHKNIHDIKLPLRFDKPLFYPLLLVTVFKVFPLFNNDL